ncbi:MAG: ABC transporter permease [Blastocatellia bacterium]
METFLQDLRYAVRMLIKKPAFASLAILALALGIGANSAIFSVINAVIIRPLPYPEADKLVWVWDTQPQLDRAPSSLADFLDWREQNQSFEYMAAYQDGNMFFDRGEGNEEIHVGLVTTDMFSLMKVSPVLGRTFTDEETRPGHFRVILLSHSLWKQRFASDENVIGQTVSLSGFPYTVIGVMPDGFGFPNQSMLWRPFPIDPNRIDRGSHFLKVVARLKPNVALDQAQAEMSAIAGRLAEAFPEKIAGHNIKLEPLHDVLIGNIRPVLFVLLAAVGFVLLIACANVANLLLARAASRQKEMALRCALGASRARIIKQLLTESVMLAIAGGALGLALSVWGVKALTALGANNIPRAQEIGLDWWVVGFTFSISILTGVVFGLAPALQVSNPDLNETLKESGRTTAGAHSGRVRSLLVIAEVALSLVLLIGAGLMIKSLHLLNEVKPGFNPDKLLTMGVTLLSSRYPEDQQVIALYQQLLERLGSAPGAESAAAISDLPLGGNNTNDYFTVEGRPAIAKEEQPLAEYRVITPDYFKSMGIPMLSGRDIALTDTKQTPNVAVINESFARRHFPDGDAIGHRLRFQGQQRDPLLIVGIVGDVHDFGLDEKPTPEAYVPFLQDPLRDSSYARSMTLVVRTKSDPEALAGAFRSEALAVDKSLPVYSIKPMSGYMRDSLSQRRLNMMLLGIFAAVALVLAAVGIYGVLSYTVSQRTHEIGIRMAVGARPSDILKLVVRQAMSMALAGVAVGLVASFALTRLMSSLLFGVSATDPATFALISIILTGVALAACFVPARRATKVDPMIALRYE